MKTYEVIKPIEADGIVYSKGKKVTFIDDARGENARQLGVVVEADGVGALIGDVKKLTVKEIKRVLDFRGVEYADDLKKSELLEVLHG